MKARKDRIIVAMSGGVDSSVAAMLLKKAGFDVIGIFMKFWNPSTSSGQEKENRCCSVESENLARSVAKKIGIPFYVLNVEKEFKKKIVDYFLREYKKGNTPNPCVVCNKEIKFGFLIKKALSLGADFVATGHYARTSLAPLSGARLIKAKDKDKDQSYFLWQLSQEQLKCVMFPVGGYTKQEVRKLAKKFNLPTAETPESQEVCFIKDSTNDFLKKYLKIKPGKIIVRNNSRELAIGRHNGLWFYTTGQRKGIGLSGGPYYVVNKDFKKNILIVSKNQKDLLKKELIAKDVNWIMPQKLPIRVKVKIRYKSELSDALIRANKGGIRIIFKKPRKAITPGQSAVFYRGEQLLGGGVIC